MTSCVPQVTQWRCHRAGTARCSPRSQEDEARLKRLQRNYPPSRIRVDWRGGNLREPVPRPVVLLPGYALECRGHPRPIKSEPQSPRKIPMRKPRTRRAFAPRLARPRWGTERRPRPPTKCSGVTRGPLLKAQGRGRGARPLSARSQGRVSSEQPAVAVAGVSPAARALDPRPESQPLRTAPGDAMGSNLLN